MYDSKANSPDKHTILNPFNCCYTQDYFYNTYVFYVSEREVASMQKCHTIKTQGCRHSHPALESE